MEKLNKQYDENLSIRGQKELCDKTGYPHFAPENGRCWSCDRNIYQPIGWKMERGERIRVDLDSKEIKFITGVTVEDARDFLVTGCPHCNRSYCD